MSRPLSPRIWLQICDPALAYTAAQLAGKRLLLPLCGAQAAGDLTVYLLVPVILFFLYRQKQRRQAEHTEPRTAHGLCLWLTVTALLTACNLLFFPSQASRRTLLHFTASVLCAPLCEEAVYREFTFIPAESSLGLPGAVMLSSLLFAAGHGSAHAFLPAFFVGMILCWMRKHFDSLRFPILTHAVLNLTAYLM